MPSCDILTEIIQIIGRTTREADGYNPDGNNVGFNESTGQFQIEINGLVEPKSKDAQRICKEDLNEVITAFVQDKTSLERGLFASADFSEPSPEYSSDKELLAELGVEAPKESDVTYLKHVKSRAEVRAAEEIANRKPCEDFDTFRPIFL